MRLAGWVVALCAFAVLGCSSTLKGIDNSGLPMRSATPNQLIDQLNRDAAAITLFKGKLSMGIQRDPDQSIRRCSGMLLAANAPDGCLYLKGYRRLLPTFFTLVSDGNEFWLHIPRDALVYTGAMGEAWSRGDSLDFQLNADDLSQALFVRPVGPGADFVVRDQATEYEVTVLAHGAVQRRLWVEKQRFTVVREVHYDQEGIGKLEILRQEYVDLEGHLYPARLIIRDAASGAQVFLNFSSIALDPENVPLEVFQFQVPTGTEVRRVTNDRART